MLVLKLTKQNQCPVCVHLFHFSATVHYFNEYFKRVFQHYIYTRAVCVLSI